MCFTKIKKRLSSMIVYLIIAIALIIVTIPLYWLVITAFKPGWAIVNRPPIIIPTQLTLEHFHKSVFGSVQFTGALASIKDSLIIAIGNTVLSLTIGLFAAYSIVRFRTGGQHLSFWILSNRFLPPVAFIIPLYLILRKLHLFDTHLSLILIYCTFNVPFATWLLLGFIEQIPEDLENAAMVDGCSRMGAFLRISLPLALPGIAVSTLFCFLFAWNEYVMAFLLTGEKINTLPKHIPKYRGAHDILYGEISAVTIVAIIPAVILAFMLQKYLTRGLTTGAIRE